MGILELLLYDIVSDDGIFFGDGRSADARRIDETKCKRHARSIAGEDRERSTDRRFGAQVAKAEEDYVRSYDRSAGGPRTSSRGRIKNVDRDD